jgi:aspartyl-tRNA(Asn)/glutamyl-tRNA(Gln) amidotransferase subunit A
MIADDFQAAFKDCDVIAGPWRPPWPGSSASKADPLAYLADIFTLPARWPACPA